MDTGDRSRRILAALVREYIASGEPVASSSLAGAAGLGMSSATVRNILAQLEDEGLRAATAYVGRPACRPTAGTRFYVDLLLESKRSMRTASAVEARLRRDGEPIVDSLLSRASLVVSQASRHVGFALRPAHEVAVFDRVEFIPISSARVLVVIIARGGHVLQKVVDVSETLDAAELRQASNYLNAEFSGLPIHRAREAVLERMSEERLLYDALMARALRLASSTFADLEDQGALYVDGAASLLGVDQGLTLGTMQTLLLMIEEKAAPRASAERIHRRPGADGRDRRRTSRSQPAIVQPRRFDLRTMARASGRSASSARRGMRYSRAIAVVDGAAQAVSRVLRNPN